MASGHETEIKLRVESVERGQQLLERAGFLLHTPSTLEVNVVYDTQDRTLRQTGRVLRLRDYGDARVLTFKGPAVATKHKTRLETETSVGSTEVLAAVFAELGYRPVFRYEKMRAEYRFDSGTATLDETPIGIFIELEGDPEWIDASALRMGFGESDYITESYGRLYLAHCAEQVIEPGDMVFHCAKGL